MVEKEEAEKNKFKEKNPEELEKDLEKINLNEEEKTNTENDIIEPE
jgi:hypothetical protein